MIAWPRMVGNIWALCIVLQVSSMFLLSGLEASSGFSYVVPRAVFTWDFINSITLEIRRLSELWRREFLLKGFEWFVDHADFIVTDRSNLVRGSVRPLEACKTLVRIRWFGSFENHRAQFVWWRNCKWGWLLIENVRNKSRWVAISF